MMRGFRPRPKRSSEAFSNKGGKKDEEKFFSDEDEFDNLYYSAREKDYVKKSTKWEKSLLKKAAKLPPPPPPPPAAPPPPKIIPNDELTFTEDTQNVSTSTNKTELKDESSKTRFKKDCILTKELTQTGISKIFKGTIAKSKKDHEAVKESQLKNVVSLHLQNKGFQKIMPDAFQSFGSLAHLYLYDNKIVDMVGLSSLPQLESLYLSGNQIKRIENLDNSFNLRQLYLGHNEIEVIEGLENLSMLVELHIECQKLPREQSLIFCPNSLETISKKLKVLNTSGNQIESIEDFACMDVLDTLNLSRNKLSNLDHVSGVLRRLRQLRVLDLRENASIVKDHKYKEKIIGFCGGIELLDGKEINDTQRTTLQRMCAMKATRIRNQQLKFNQNVRQHPIHPVSSFPGAFQHHQVHPEQQQQQMMNQTRSLTMAMMMPMMPISIDVQDINVNENFVFSTPISMSPTALDQQHDIHQSNPSITRQMMANRVLDGTQLDDTSEVEIAIQKEVANFYAGRSGIVNILPAEEESPAVDEPEKMSEMAKIIFRLSNLSPSHESLGRASSSRSDPSHSTSAQHYWTNSSSRGGGGGLGDRFSKFKESRPLSPLEVDVVGGSSTNAQSRFLHDTRSTGGLSVGRRNIVRRPMARKLPPRNSVLLLGGLSGAGRTLSPLQELPTPDSTVRGDPAGNEGRHHNDNKNDWFSSPQSSSSLQPSTCSLPTLSQLPKKNKGVVGARMGFMPSVTKIKSQETTNSRRKP